LIKYLIELGANPNGRNTDGTTPLSRLFLAFSWYSGHTFSRTGYNDEGQIDRCLEEMFARGAKWEPTDGHELSIVRKALYNKWANSILPFIRMLKHHKACSDEIMVQLMNTGRMRWILREHERDLFKLLPQLKDRAIPQWKKPRRKRRKKSQSRRQTSKISPQNGGAPRAGDCSACTSRTESAEHDEPTRDQHEGSHEP
jgi:hypothetical protein